MKNATRILLFSLLTCTLFSACTHQKDLEIVQGVSKSIANYRSQSISNPEYDLKFSIPDSIHQAIAAYLKVNVNLLDVSQPLILDYSAPADYIHSVNTNGHEEFEMLNGHVIIPTSSLIKGKNTIEINFRAGETSLNRNKEFLYTLFVPDRASTAFPCFDQPNMKAKYNLEIEMPEDWTAVSNGPDIISVVENGRRIMQFGQTEKLSTYLFSFVVGKFERITKTIDGRKMTMLHREPDSNLVARNLDQIFGLHAKGLNWLEDYTQVKYPFQKFDFVAIPFFQYGGMEHAGAIQYRANSLFLEENATQNQKLGRAGLISHETAHMWFGDLVTMNWFDDVWLKEVFAGFMADKIINPSFPEVNHDLKFLLSHYTAAYEVDRSSGANPIGQKLENMKNAGTLYGGIIYHKAPIAMRHLENIMGAEKLQLGLQEYLQQFAYSNATWDQLIEILNKHTDIDLVQWSQIWIKEPGMPTIETSIESEGDKMTAIKLVQSDPFGQDRVWPQHLSVELFYNDLEKNKNLAVNFDQKEVYLTEVERFEKPEMVLPNGMGFGYGYFKLDQNSKAFLFSNINEFENPVKRGIAWLTLWENMLNNNLDKIELFKLQLSSLKTETDLLLIGKILSQTSAIFWQFLTPEQRENLGPHTEELLWSLINQSIDAGLKKNYFNSYKSIALSEEAVSNLYKIWNGELKIDKLHLSGNDQTSLAYNLALKMPDNAEDIINEQLSRIDNPDRKAQISFVTPALSKNEQQRDQFFQSLKDPRNREHERWVVTALNYLNHPLRCNYSIKYLKESLELLQEIQLTGDIFFPKQWLDAILGGYNSEEAAEIIHQFLKDHPDYPENLKGKILQSADFIFRSKDILSN